MLIYVEFQKILNNFINTLVLFLAPKEGYECVSILLTLRSKLICLSPSTNPQIYGPICSSIKVNFLIPNLLQEPGQSINPRILWHSFPPTNILSGDNNRVMFIPEQFMLFLDLDFLLLPSHKTLNPASWFCTAWFWIILMTETVMLHGPLVTIEIWVCHSLWYFSLPLHPYNFSAAVLMSSLSFYFTLDFFSSINLENSSMFCL